TAPGTRAGPGAWSGDAALARSDDDLLAGTVAARTAACVAHARPGVPGRPLLPRRVPAPGHARTAGHRGAGDPRLPLRDAQPSARTGRRAHGPHVNCGAERMHAHYDLRNPPTTAHTRSGRRCCREDPLL